MSTTELSIILVAIASILTNVIGFFAGHRIASLERKMHALSMQVRRLELDKVNRDRETARLKLAEAERIQRANG